MSTRLKNKFPQRNMTENRKIPIKVELDSTPSGDVVYNIKLTKKGARLYSGMTLRFDPIKEELIIDYGME